jgi:hypothetical protein
MTTQMLSTISVIPRRVEHELGVLSRHHTSEGVVTWARCTCGDVQLWLTHPGDQAPTLIKSTGRCG